MGRGGRGPDGVQHRSTATTPDSRGPWLPLTPMASWDDGRPPGAAVVRDQEAVPVGAGPGAGRSGRRGLGHCGSRNGYLRWPSPQLAPPPAMYNGDPGPMINSWADSDDITLFGAWGPIEKGHKPVTDTMRWVGSRFTGADAVEVKHTVVASSGDLAYTVGFERSHVSQCGSFQFPARNQRLARVSAPVNRPHSVEQGWLRTCGITRIHPDKRHWCEAELPAESA